jgi:septal ring factor EnvC (AmiA/AmiB activator)
MLQGYGDTVLRAEALEEERAKARKHSAMLQSKLDGAFARTIMKSRTCRRRATNWCARTSRSAIRTKVCCCLVKYLLEVPCGSLTSPSLLIAELETRVEQLKASEVDMKNLFYREKEAREVLEYDYKQLAYECDKHMELRIASDRDLVNCYKSLQKLNEDCEKLRAQLKELEEAALPIAMLLVPHPGGPKIAPLVDRLREAPTRLATYVKHLVRSIPNQILAYMKSYFPKAPVDVVAGGLAANCTNEQYAELMEQMAPIAKQVAEKLNLQ